MVVIEAVQRFVADELVVEKQPRIVVSEQRIVMGRE